MATINIQQYLQLATSMQKFKPRDPHLVAESCLDVYPLYSTGVRQLVRKQIINHLRSTAR